MRPNPYLMKKKELIKYNTGRCKHRHTYAEHPACWFEEQERRPKIGFVDIETSNLNATYGIIIVYCILDDDTDDIIERHLDVADLRSGNFDKNLCKQLINDLLKFDILMGYWSTHFDIPYMRARCLKWRLNFPIFKTIDHKDIYYMVKRLLKLHRNSLNVATNFLGIKGKNHVWGDQWLQALMCDGKIQEKAMDYIIDHCKRDVRITKKTYQRLREFDKGMVKSI